MVVDRAGMTVPGWDNAWGPIPRGRSAAGGSCNYAYNTTNVGGSVDKNNIRKYAGVEASIAGASKHVPVTNTVVIMDGVFFVSSANGAYPQSSSYELFWPYHFMHLDKANTLFLDGHVSGLRYQQFYISQGTWSAATGFALVGRD